MRPSLNVVLLLLFAPADLAAADLVLNPYVGTSGSDATNVFIDDVFQEADSLPPDYIPCTTHLECKVPCGDHDWFSDDSWPDPNGVPCARRASNPRPADSCLQLTRLAPVQSTR